MTWLLILVLGLAVGSFLNVVSYRLPRDQNLVHPPSHCPRCGQQLAWYDLIPLWSFLWLWGRCRHCGERIAGSYFLGELSTGLIFLGCGWWWLRGPVPDWFHFWITALFVSLSLTIARIDWSFSIIPNEISYGLLLSGILFGFYSHYPLSPVNEFGLDPGQALQAGLGILLGGGLFLLLAVLSPLLYGKPALGMGDVKLMAAYGAWLGPGRVLLTMILGSLLGALIGTTAMLWQGKSLRTEIPFGPFLCLAAVISLLYGGELIRWYLQLT